MLDHTHTHAGIETRHSRESNYRFVVLQSARELLPIVGVENDSVSRAAWTAEGG
jgi:ubiquinone biosynthesis protein COQ9